MTRSCGGGTMTALKRLRQERGITQVQLAASVGVDKREIQRWENGRGRPRDIYLPPLSRALGCREADIWTPPIKYWLRGYDEERIQKAGVMAPMLRRRLELEMSLKELSSRSGVGERTLSDLEAGRHTPTWDTRQKIRRALDMPEERYFTVEERNQKFARFEKIIQWVMNQHFSAMQRLNMDHEDVFQDLALCTIRAIDRYYPKENAGTIETYVIRNLMGQMKHLIYKHNAGGLVGGDAKCSKIPLTTSLECLLEDGAQFAG